MRRLIALASMLFATCGALADVNITNIPVAVGVGTNDTLLGVTNSTHAALVPVRLLNMLFKSSLLGTSNQYTGGFVGDGTYLTHLDSGFIDWFAVEYDFTNAYFTNFTADGAGITNIPAASIVGAVAEASHATNADNMPVIIAGTNIWVDVNGKTNKISTFEGIALTNWVIANFEPVGGGLATNVPILKAGTNIWIDVSGLTNTISTLDGIATTNYVGTYYYLQSNPSNFVTASITNGLAPTNYVGTYYYLQSNPSNYVTASVTNGLATTNYVGTYYYLVSNPSNYVTASVTNGLATTNWVGQNFWQTNQSVPFDIYTNSSGALSNPLSATALAFQQGYGISRTWTVSNNIAITTASIDTNTVITTNGGTFVGQILDNSVSSDSPAANQLVKASWVRGLFSGGTFLYNITNAHPVDATWYIASATTNSTGQTRTYVGVTNNQYLGTGIMSTQAFTTVYSPMTVNAYLSFNSGGAKAVSVKPEFYYVYTNLATNAVSNLLGDYDCGPQALSAGTNLYSFVISFPTISSTNPFFVVRRFKVTSQTLNPDVSIHGSGTTPSHISFSTPPASQVASSVYASNVISGGVLPAGTVSSTSLTPGYALGTDGSARIWTNSLNGVSIGGNAATASGGWPTQWPKAAITNSDWITGNQSIALSGDATGSGTTAIAVSTTNISGAYTNRIVTTNDSRTFTLAGLTSGLATLAVGATNDDLGRKISTTYVTAAAQNWTNAQFTDFSIAGVGITISPTNGNLQSWTAAASTNQLAAADTNYTETIRLHIYGSNTVTWLTANLSNYTAGATTLSNNESVIIFDHARGTNLWWAYRLR